MSQTPSNLPYYDPSDAPKLWIERTAEVEKAARIWRMRFPDRNEGPKIAALGIDCQVAFCHPGASLYVPGADQDMRRAAEWIYRNTDKISQIYLSLDTHTAVQVFHPTSWMDANGQHPTPFTVIMAADVVSGKWKPCFEQDKFLDLTAAMIEYCTRLESTGKYALTIWPYHAMLGGASHGIMPILMEACLFHSIGRLTDIEFIMKGRSQFTENFSIFSPEVNEIGNVRVGTFDIELVHALSRYDRVYIFGEASSHCVMSSLYDLAKKLSPDDLNKIYILTDAMSPVPPPPLDPLPEALNFPMIASKALADFAALGFNLAKTTDILEV